MATREELHQLVSSLPEDALDAACAILVKMQGGRSGAAAPEPGLEHFVQAQQHMQERLQERMRVMVELLARRKPGR
jgi:hypothetical protein